VVPGASQLSTLGAICRLWIYGQPDDACLRLLHGSRNQQLDPSQTPSELSSAPLVGGCHSLSALAVAVLHRLGIEARLVAVMTKQQRNGIDDGHTLVEFRDAGGEWKVFDPSFGTYWNASLLDVCSQERSDAFQYLSLRPYFAGWRTSSVDLHFWIRSRFSSREVLASWYERVMGTPLFYDRGAYYYPEDALDISAHLMLKQCGYRPDARQTIVRNFYTDSSESQRS